VDQTRGILMQQDQAVPAISPCSNL